MGNVTEVRDADEEPALLTSREVEGLSGGRLLADAPLADHLDPAERPRYVLRNRSRGVTVGDDAERPVEPDDRFQALAAVTNVNVYFAVGREDGDEVLTVPLADVYTAKAEDGLLASTLRVVTDDETVYEFPCRGDLEGVVAHVNRTGRTWARCDRILEDVHDAVDEAERLVADEAFEAAEEPADEAADFLETARDRLSELGEGALAAFEDHAAEAIRRVETTPRWIHAERARVNHVEARSRWTDVDYETAYDRYREAIDAYQWARSRPGEDPSDEVLQRRFRQAQGELETLSAAPLQDAEEAASRASQIDEPVRAAAEWETAVERYRLTLWLDEDREERRFDGNPDTIRSTLVALVEEAVACRRQAAEACRQAARDHARAGYKGCARRAYDTALAHLERAQSVVDDVAPARVGDLDSAVESIEVERDAVAEHSSGPLPFGRVAGLRSGGRGARPAEQ